VTWNENEVTTVNL